LKPIFTQKWVSVDMNWGGGSTPQPPTIPTQATTTIQQPPQYPPTRQTYCQHSLHRQTWLLVGSHRLEQSSLICTHCWQFH